MYTNNANLFRAAETHEKVQETYCTAQKAGKILRMNSDSLKRMLESGELSRDLYVEREGTNSLKKKYMYKEDKLREIADEYTSLESISKQNGIPYSKVYSAVNAYPDLVKKFGRRYHIRSVLSLLESEQCRTLPKITSADFLADDTRAFIDSYVDHVSSNTPRITVVGIVVSRSSLSSQEVSVRHKRELQNTIFQLALARQGHYHKFGAFGRIDLDESILKSLDYNFNFDLFDSKDVKNLEKLYEPQTFHQRVESLKKLLFYWIMQREDKLRKRMLTEGLSLEEERREERNLSLVRSSILSAFDQVPTRKNLQFADDETRSVFLTREEYVKFFIYVLKEYGLKDALLVAFSFILGLRRSEATKLAIEDFEINDEGFLVANNDDGYGRLNVPAPKSKGGYGPSSLIYGTLVPPYLVKLINIYLKEMYAICPFRSHRKYTGKTFKTKNILEVYKEGHGYFFRPNMNEPDCPYHPMSISVRMKRLKANVGDILPDEKRSKLSFHDGRHSMNEWIETARVDSGLMDQRDWAADLQMRHNRTKAARGDVGKSSYRDHKNIDFLKKYKRIIDQSINFPMDLKDLHTWEEMNGYSELIQYDLNDQLHENYEPSTSVQETVINMKEATSKQLKELEAEFELSRTRGNQSMKEWIRGRMEMVAEIQRLKQAIGK
ncbi:hypothetical protein [Paenibacillus sp. BC26]|uniref:hypothetical protein n=1 Tax=Paenibacillus sp. BC26 TaxID=1881032 RepID=UPI0008EDF8B2|nr:hypothetical protein [Paenibacillus sp. BC26]SFS75806.1 hypothetical protein SAMN05428962_2676 [Paenibacillus sp. BC26]